MSMSILGERFDIHTGGADNVFPHHEAEIAQSEAVTGHQVVSIWMHGGLLMLSGARMAKSAGNFFRITELEEQGFDPLAFRYLALQAKYRAPLNFSTDGLAGADRALRQLRERIAGWSAHPGEDIAKVSEEWESRFRTAIADDLDLRRPAPEGSLPAGAAELLAAREKARAAKDFARSDQLREELGALGVTVFDTAGGQRIKK